MTNKMEAPVVSFVNSVHGTDIRVSTPSRTVTLAIQPDGGLVVSVSSQNTGEQSLMFTYKGDIVPEVEAAAPSDPEQVTPSNNGVLGMWRVSSDSNPEYKYVVALWKSGTWTCTCPHFENRRPVGGCKHIQRKKESPTGEYLIGVQAERR